MIRRNYLPDYSPVFDLPVEKLRLDDETCKYLKNARIKTVGDIVSTEREKGLLKGVRNIGRKHYESIRDAMQSIGLLPDGGALPAVAENGPSAEPDAAANTAPAPARETVTDPARLKTVVFVDYAHWYIGLKKSYQRRPNIQAWFDDAKTRGNLVEVTFFGDFSENGGMQDEINNIRLFTNRIIETKNTGVHLKKDFTDFIMLDNIYQKVMSFPDVEQIILFTGDGHFSSIISYLRNFCSKTVGIYGVDDAISRQLEASSDWCVKVPLDTEKSMGCRRAILRNLKYAETHSKAPMFRNTAQFVSEEYGFDHDLVEAELRLLMTEGIVYTLPTRSRRDYTLVLDVLKVNWALAEDAGLQKSPSNQ